MTEGLIFVTPIKGKWVTRWPIPKQRSLCGRRISPNIQHLRWYIDLELLSWRGTGISLWMTHDVPPIRWRISVCEKSNLLTFKALYGLTPFNILSYGQFHGQSHYTFMCHLVILVLVVLCEIFFSLLICTWHPRLWIDIRNVAGFVLWILYNIQSTVVKKQSVALHKKDMDKIH